MSHRYIAIDWSGDASSSSQKIWLAEVVDGAVTRLESGRDRSAIAEHLISEASKDSELVVGLDFAFSLPAWFLDTRQLRTGHDLWALAAAEAEEWLAACEPPFWGRPGRPRPGGHEPLRRTEREVPRVNGIRPKSVFQIGGAGAVGTGSLRGMPVLHQLHRAGFSIWPFDRPRLPLVVEIYPRLLTDSVVKSSPEACAAYLERRFPDVPKEIRERAARSEDAFDALVSALVMYEARNELHALDAMLDEQLRREGIIWCPHNIAGARTRHEVPERRGNGAAMIVPRAREEVPPAHAQETEASTYETPSGVTISRNFRDNLIIDRYDPVFADMRASKLKHLRSANSEDALTWNVFRSLRQIDPGYWLPQLWRAAFPDLSAPSDNRVVVKLWEAIRPPLGLLETGDEGTSEIDVMLESPTWVWFIEAKYRSDIATGTTTRPDRDQVLRNIDVGSYFAGVRPFYFSLLTLRHDRTAGAAKIAQYGDLDAVRRILRDHRPDGLRNLTGVGSLSWKSMAAVLAHGSVTAQREDEQAFARRAVEWLAEKDIVP